LLLLVLLLGDLAVAEFCRAGVSPAGAADLSARPNLIFLKVLGELHAEKIVFNE